MTHSSAASRLLTRIAGFTDNSIAAGRAYADQNRVSDIVLEPDTGLLSGIVQGTQAYKTTAKLVREHDGVIACRVGICHCPIRQNCKHVVALIAAAENDASFTDFFVPEEQPREPTFLETLLAKAKDSKSAPVIPVAGDTETPAESWEAALSALLPPAASTPSRDAPALGLQFELHVPPPRFSYRGRGNTVPSEPVLNVRPVVMGTRGKWVKSGVSWATLGYLSYGGEHDPKQLEWLSEFLSSHSPRQYVHGNAGAWLTLNNFAGRNLWQLLSGAHKSGIALVHAGSGEPVRVAGREATLQFDVTQADSGGLEVGPLIEVEGAPVKAGIVGKLGDPASGLFFSDETEPGSQGGNTAPGRNAVVRGNITVAPLAADASPQLLDFALRGETVQIPEQAREKFLTQFYPQLKQSAPVVSADHSVELPAYVEPTLSLLAAYGTDHTVRLHWEWHYPVGTRTTSLPLWPELGENAVRDTGAEARLVESVGQPWEDITAMGVAANHAWGEPSLAASVQLTDLDTLTLTETVLPRLSTLPGVTVETTGDIASYREVTEAPVVTISTKATDERDWFDLGIVITLEGQYVSFAAVFSALAAGQSRMLLPSGAHFSLDRPELHQLRELIEEARSLNDNKDGELRISRFQAGLWDELAQLGIVDEQAQAWRKAVSGLLDGGPPEALPAPETLNATLRPYQLDGFNWLHFLYTYGLGGVLADDMGLGKTVQALALMCQVKAGAEAESAALAANPAESNAAESTPAASTAIVSGSGSGTGTGTGTGTGSGTGTGTGSGTGTGTGQGSARRPFLVVAPTSVVGNWASESAKFAPGLQAVTVGETFAKSGLDSATFFAGADIVITSYALFRIDFAEYAMHPFAGLILDEAQFVKNHQSKAYQCARKIKAPFKLAVTGTPMENNLMELWALLSIVAPGLFPSPKRFAEFYQRPIEKNADAELLVKLRARVKPLMLRRTKEAVIADLPAKQEQILDVELNPRHHKIYQTHLQRERAKILGLLEDVNKNRFTIFQSLTLLRQLSLDVTLVDEGQTGVRSSKLDVLFEQLEDVVKEGHRALIFSQFTGFLGKVRDRLVAEGIDFTYLDGGTRNRAAVVDDFKTGTAPLFLISLKAGGFGLNLTEADYVFILDPWWNPASEAQAVDRTHRIGQKKNVMVYRLVAKDTIEEKVMALKAKKSQLFSDVMSGDSLAGGALTATDLAGLFRD
ncbi:DEAD/DEAH box helicase [Arthrobacter sp. H35-D1]|uniref:DEAD/DEAH box helicase n=1 Tax=Arthrobacter sp. H35-D1 TaxID=3046202 RepID=UPI0024BB4765|nr:DEAD/DEAH box helicase [Arthrobacter sp. H35-D1]MDJ0311890.1 DEAD/DEAH box helicase [Arthrobacter sp. H35-D1]